jgi:ATP-dependent Clp protease ATP-binding subunit ClpA
MADSRRAREAELPYLVRLRERIIGQECIAKITPYLDMVDANLNPPGRPAGVFMLLGPTGTGKTRTVEAVAELLHNDSRRMLRVDCGEYQLEHEVAKLVGAPPGYLGHKETQAILTQQRIDSICSEHSRISVVLFDEIEKAAPSMQRILLGILDKGFLRTGDNNPVNFENTLIFLTSNIGYAEIGQMRNAPGFTSTTSTASLATMVEQRLKRKFSPEFINRIDELLYYEELSKETLRQIVEIELAKADDWLVTRWGFNSCALHFDDSAKDLFVKVGFEAKYGARPLKRAITHLLWQPLAVLKTSGKITAGITIHITADGDKLAFSQEKRQAAT